jgi:hypothetical protein
MQWHARTLLNRNSPSNSGVLTAKARHHAGAAMFIRSTPGCGFLEGPSLEFEGFQSQKQKGSADSLGLKYPGVLGRPAKLKSLLLKGNDTYIPGIYLVCYIVE